MFSNLLWVTLFYEATSIRHYRLDAVFACVCVDVSCWQDLINVFIFAILRQSIAFYIPDLTFKVLCVGWISWPRALQIVIELFNITSQHDPDHFDVSRKGEFSMIVRNINHQRKYLKLEVSGNFSLTSNPGLRIHLSS